MKIAIRIDAGHEYGMGHYTRMNALSNAFDLRGIHCDMYCRDDEPIDFDGYSIIIIDSYWVSGEYISNLNAPRRMLVCYDDNALYEYSCDVVLNANLYANELRFRFGEKMPVLLLGGGYALLRKEFIDSRPIEVKEKANKVFICFGGTDVNNQTPLAVKELAKDNSLELFVVLGSATECDNEVRKYESDRVHISKSPDRISDVMGMCDIALTSSSTTIYELAVLGLPALTVKMAENQTLIADYTNKQQLFKCLGDWKKYDYSQLGGEVVSLLADYCRRVREHNMMKRLVDKNGANNVVETLLKMWGAQHEIAG